MYSTLLNRGFDQVLMDGGLHRLECVGPRLSQRFLPHGSRDGLLAGQGLDGRAW